MKKVIIIGAGLSGLYAAKKLEDDYEVIILEARSRLGGRVYSIDGLDMGPSWVWSHQPKILELLGHYQIELLEHRDEGLALYDASEGVQTFQPQPQAPSARAVKGLGSLIEAIAQDLQSTTIEFEIVVSSIKDIDEKVEIKTSKGNYQADILIFTLPPRLAIELNFEPELPKDMKQKMADTPTWMAHTAKSVMTFKSDFWKQKGQSGFAFSNRGPMSEIHDVSIPSVKALFGFFHHKAGTDKEAIMAQLIRIFGAEVREELLDIHVVDWRKEKFTTGALDDQPLRDHPNYGLDLVAFDKKLYFIGTESANKEGGYLEGALESVDQLLARGFEG